MSKLFTDTRAFGAKVIIIRFNVIVNDIGVDFTIFFRKRSGINGDGSILISLGYGATSIIEISVVKAE